MRLSDGEQQRMEQRLALRFAAIGNGAQSWLERQLSALSPDCALLTRWCYSASPVSDWANYEFSLFRACAEHALRLREQSPLARELPEPLFLNYVLHPRVNEEELCDCRGFFYAQIRGRIEGLSAREAILAINEWNAEQVCYRATDERTISALGAWRSGFGRCGEESTFAVNVLRAAGIPARQVYTPRWAHCDDNHAWVEAYCGGAWHFFGACEPEEALDRGWFTGAASRALLVHSRCFGTPAADEEIISVDGAVTFLNQTARYAPVRLLAVRVREKDGRPAAGAEVTFGILNASEVFPAAVIRTDADGMARLRCGYGDLIVQARKNGLCRETLCPASQEEPLELTLAEPEAPAGRWTSFTLHAPKERLPERSAPTPAQRAAATEKQAAADEKRRLRLEAAYDAARIRALRERFGTLQRWQSCWRIRRIPRRGSLRFCRRWGRRTCAMSGPPFCARRWTRAAAFRRRMNFPCNIFSARASGQNRCPAGEGRWRTASRRRGSGNFAKRRTRSGAGSGNRSGRRRRRNTGSS